MAKITEYPRKSFFFLSILILISLISFSVVAQEGKPADSAESPMAVIFLLCFMAPFFILAIFGLLWTILYPILVIWAFLFSSKKLDAMIMDTANREAQTFAQLGKDPLSTLDGGFKQEVSDSGVVMAGAVYGPSHWHLLIGFINNLFGGSVDIFQKVISAGRAESMQRLREKAIKEGWDEVINVRIDTAVMSPATTKKGIRAVEVFVYGTGIKYS
ncbi:MAG: hypothetical protein CMB08_03450 [Euryarchaeota archaeon]|nr:hypothetical protein [Euryarchaeota archaeon]